MILGKKELVDKISERLNAPKATVKNVVDEMFNTLKDEFKKGNDLKINGFGVFSVKKLPKRMRRNPMTGETIVVNPSMAVKFKASLALKKYINN